MTMRTLSKQLVSAPVIVALVIMTLAVGGSAYAAGKITGKQIAKNTVTSKNIKNGTLKTKDVSGSALAEIQANAEAKDKAYAVRRTTGAGSQPASSTVNIKSLALPAGTFTLMSRVGLDDISGAPKTVECQLVQGATVIDSVYQTLSGAVGGFYCTNMAVVTLAAPATITMRVLTPAASSVRLGSDDQIIATQVSSASVITSAGAN